MEKPVDFNAVHCPWCGGASPKSKEAKGHFDGSVGNSLVRYYCPDCGRHFNLLITGDVLFPERGFGAVAEDFSLKLAS